jgi:hypothetical protein
MGQIFAVVRGTTGGLQVGLELTISAMDGVVSASAPANTKDKADQKMRLHVCSP